MKDKIDIIYVKPFWVYLSGILVKVLNLRYMSLEKEYLYETGR